MELVSTFAELVAFWVNSTHWMTGWKVVNQIRRPHEEEVVVVVVVVVAAVVAEVVVVALHLETPQGDLVGFQNLEAVAVVAEGKVAEELRLKL